MAIWTAPDRGVMPDGMPMLEQGDIVAIRPVTGYVGMRELHSVVWLLIEGRDNQEMSELAAKWYAEYDKDGNPASGAVLLAQRRYCIPLERLKDVVPTFDMNKSSDPNVLYQPFLPVDPDNAIRIGAGRYSRSEKLLLETVPTALPVQGLVFDKSTGSYL
jgi:hypothetical protein